MTSWRLRCARSDAASIADHSGGLFGIEDGVRARVRGFIETMLEAELSEALSRPRYGRRRLGEDEATPSVVGMRHGHRERTLTGTFGKTRIAVRALG